MSTPVRYDEQYCPIARALDVLGDRWTLPILRELSFGDQRFTDLREHLPGIAPTMLTQRLRELTDEGLVTTRPTESPRLRELARWGMPLLEQPQAGQSMRPQAAVRVAIANYYDSAAADGIDERYELHVGDERIVLSSVKGGGRPHPKPDVVIATDAATLIDLRQQRITLRQARDAGRLVTKGPARSIRYFQRIFQVP